MRMRTARNSLLVYVELAFGSATTPTLGTPAGDYSREILQRNVHPKFVQDLLGHASVAITLDAYFHMLPSMGGKAADAIGEALG